MPTAQNHWPQIPKSSPLRITALSLSGSVDPDVMAAGAARLRERGCEVDVPPAAIANWRYFAGDDNARLAALDAALESDAEVVMFGRGGYGLSRILHRIDWARVAASGKVFCGFSDLTAFSLAALAKANYVTYAGPVLAGVLPEDETVREFVEGEFFDVIGNRSHAYPECETDIALAKQHIDGTLWGTNLAMIAHVAGTPFMPRVDDGILLIEDIAESPYRVERMLWQLKHAGILDRQRAIVLGEFTNCDPSPALRYPYAMYEVIETLREMVSCPVLTGFPFGHVAKKTTLPMGAHATLSIDGAKYVLRLKGN
jgi:muramoyltetrapeptide carboxypeptidase